LKITGLQFHQTFSVDAMWDKDERVNVWDQKVKGQGHSMTNGSEGRRRHIKLL